MNYKEIALQSNSLTIRGYLKYPDSYHGPLVIIMHGLMDNIEFPLTRKQADGYVKQGYAVLCMDFMGHGKSDGAMIDMTISKELNDAKAILAYAKALDFASDIIVIGHSQGAVVACLLASLYPHEINKLVLLAPGWILEDAMKSGYFSGTHFDTNNPPEHIEIFNDHVGKGYIKDLLNMDMKHAIKHSHDQHILIIEAEKDEFISRNSIMPFEKIYKENHNDVCIKTIKDASHDFENKEDEVINIVLDFIKKDRH